MLDGPGKHVINTSSSSHKPSAASEAGECQVLRYLYQCFLRLNSWTKVPEELRLSHTRCHSIIISNGKTCMQHPEFFPGLDLAKQFIDIFMDELNSQNTDQMQAFFESVAMAVDVDLEEGTVFEVFRGIFDSVKKTIQKDIQLGNSLIYPYLDLLMFFTRQPCLARAFMEYNQTGNPDDGASYENTLLGAVMSISCIVKNDAGPYEFFTNPSQYSRQEHDLTESSLHQPLNMLSDKIHLLLKAFLKVSTEVKHRTLEWLGNCLRANAGRAKIWSSHMPAIFNRMYCSDGFFLNMCSVLLRLCQPFSAPCSPKLLKIKPTYCLATDKKNTSWEQNVHMTDLSDQTWLVPSEENERLKPEDSYNFMTECFFMAHYCLHVGFHAINEKFMKLNQNLHRIQSVYQDVHRQGGDNSETGQRIKTQMDKGMTLFLCMKAALLEPEMLEDCLNFHIATATYLNNIATNTDLTKFTAVKFPLLDPAPSVMTCIPEFIIENIMDFMIFIRRFKDTMYEMLPIEKLEHLMTLVLVFMGSRNRLHNPHLRAKMAEALESLMPPQNEDNRSVIASHYQRQKLFNEHPLIDNLGATLLHVFVSIEMTGQGVEFEQKFNYRRPMYKILEYIWAVKRHNQAIKNLARQAEENIEASNPPLFLQFMNLLINDAIFLLDEALQYMSDLKKKKVPTATLR